MTFTTTQEATRANLVICDDTLIDIQPLHEAAVEALTAFGLALSAPSGISFDSACLTAGPVRVTVAIDDGAGVTPGDGDTSRLTIEVAQLRASESLHPEAPTAILAEILSLLIERTGGQSVEWGPERVAIPAPRFQSAFTPLRARGRHDRIVPRRIRPAETAAPRPARAEVTMPDLKAVFAVSDVEPETPSLTRRASTWTATASVGVMNPAIGIPLAAYNLIKGEDLRITSHAFAITATLSGLTASTIGYLPFF